MIRHPRWIDLPGWIAFGWSLWHLLLINSVYMRPPTCLNRWDEGYITAFAWRMLDGQMLPYVDAVSQRGPLLYWLASIPVWVWGPTSWMPVRVLGTASIVLTLVFAFAAACRAGRALAGGVAGIAMVAALFLMMGLSDGLAFNGEHALNVFAMAAAS